MFALKIEGKHFNESWDSETDFHWEEWDTLQDAMARARFLRSLGAKVTIYEAL
jgi:hypothetical protein